MPRKPRESSGTGIYHVMLRGINRQDIFEDAEDYYTFIRMMAMVANQGNQGDNMSSLKISPIIWRIGK